MRSLIGLAGSAWLCAAAAPPPAPSAVLDAALMPFDRSGSPGCAVGVIERGHLVHARGVGAADIATGRPIGPSTPFNLASMSKSVTAAAIALLVRDGTIGLDDDIRRWLPELPDYGRTIRVRHLLHHMSGLRNHMALAAFQPGAPLPSHAEALALVFRQSALNFAPGSRHQYESPNYVLLAEIVARASGKPFDRFLAERIFTPLGMHHTGFAVPDPARAYAPDGQGGFTLAERVNGARGSSNLVSTLEDFATWLQALDGDALGAGLLDTMMAGGRLDDGTSISYSYGLSVDRDHGGVTGLTMIAHRGQTAAFRSGFTYFPDRGFGTIMLCNVSNAPLDAVEAATAAWVGAAFPPPAAAAAAAAQPLTPEQAARFAGQYLDAEADEVRSFSADGGALNFVYFGQPYPLTHLGGGRFALGDLGSFAFADGAMTENGPDQPAIRFTRLPPPGEMRLGDYAGRYRSPDVDGEIVIEPGTDALQLNTPFGRFPVAPLHPDGFWAPQSDVAHLAFTRDPARAVTGFTMTTTSGINRMRFERIR